MFSLKNYLTSDGELTAKGRRLLVGGSWLYFLMLCILCSIPQVPEPGMETPGIQYLGLYPKSSQYLLAVALNFSIALPLSEIAEDQEGCMAELWD